VAAEAADEAKHGSGISAVSSLLLVLLCLILYLPGFFSLPPIDRDEARFAQASKQMVESGDYVDIRFQDEPRYKKPIGIYWLQAAAVALVGGGGDAPIWVYRLPSLVGAVLAVLLTAQLGARLFDRRTGFVAALLLASCLLLGVEARLAKTDAVLLACILAAQLALARAWTERDSTEKPALLPALGFWLALGAGMLVKGPIILLASGGTALLLALFERRGRWLLRLKPVPGVPVAILVVLPWLVAIGIQSDGAFFQASVGHDLLGKVLSGQESHGAPPGYYAVAVWLTFWPGSLLLFLALPWIWNHRRDSAVKFCLAWSLPVWIVFELVLTKLPHYVLPAYPALALLTARALAAGLPAPGVATAGARWAGRLRLLVVPVWLAITLALAAVLVILPSDLHVNPPLPGLPGAIGVVAIAIFGLVLLWRDRLQGTATALASSAVFLAVTAYQSVLPQVDALWSSAEIAELAKAADLSCPDPTIAAAGYAEPSLVFLVGTDTILTDAAGAAAHVTRGGPCALALVEKREESAFLAALPAVDPPVFELGGISGFNYSNGRFVELTLYRWGP
jgi:4-amino-4-deoxy-L-arabinose transferase-like glycosyltransferase